MNPRQRGFLLLSSHLGDPDSMPLTQSQLRILAQRVRSMDPVEEDRELEAADLFRLGYSREMAGRILKLLSREEVLDHYLRRGKRSGCEVITRVDGEYPLLLRQRLGLDSPGCLWLKGDRQLLNTPAVALVGSRELRGPNREFAEAVGRSAAEQGLTLVSGNARGADRAAQEACLAAGGRVVSIVADALQRQECRDNILYVSEDGYDLPFSAQRAISRNRCIHALGRMVFVAQSDLEKGGTWDGTVKNLRFGWSSVLCFRDGSEASMALEALGAYLMDTGEIPDMEILKENNMGLI